MSTAKPDCAHFENDKDLLIAINAGLPQLMLNATAENLIDVISEPSSMLTEIRSQS